MNDTVLIVGVSVRSFAESACRAGYVVSAIDGFGDLDLRAVATEVHRVTPYTAVSAARAAQQVRAAAVCYVSNFENHPSAVGRVARGRTLWGNAPHILHHARDPSALVDAVAAAGLPTARVRRRAPTERAATRRRWLIKPLASGGGHGIVAWRAGAAVPRSCVLQERLPGQPGSVLFTADGERAVVHGVTRQLVGDRRFGTRAFRYCGTLLTPPNDPTWGADSALAKCGAALASHLTRAFGLVGVNGIDVIVHKDRVVPIEINPRHTAAMELLERRDGLSVFGAHVAGCTGRLASLASQRPAAAAAGKAVVFARTDVIVRAPERWLANPDIRDIPSSDVPIRAGAPICTVFATALTVRECYERLVEQAEQIYREVEPTK